MQDYTETLTQRETQILWLIAKGDTNKRIARVLGLTLPTIKSHVSTIMDKLGAHSRVHAVVIAIRKGIIDITKLELV